MMHRNNDAHDRRGSPRLTQSFAITVLEAEVSAQGSSAQDGQNAYLARAVARKATGTDISKGGLAFETRKPYRVGTILAFEVALPEPQDCLIPLIRRFVQRQIRGFRALCQVIWVGAISAGNYRMGVRFVDTNQRRSQALDQLITEHQWQQRFMSCLEDQEDRLPGSDEDWEDFQS